MSILLILSEILLLKFKELMSDVYVSMGYCLNQSCHFIYCMEFSVNFGKIQYHVVVMKSNHDMQFFLTRIVQLAPNVRSGALCFFVNRFSDALISCRGGDACGERQIQALPEYIQPEFSWLSETASDFPFYELKKHLPLICRQRTILVF